LEESRVAADTSSLQSEDFDDRAASRTVLSTMDVAPPTLWDSVQPTADSADASVGAFRHSSCFDRDIPWSGYDPMQVVDGQGVVWESIALPSQVAPPGMVRRRRSGHPASGERLVPRPANLYRPNGQTPAAVKRLDPVVAQEAQRSSRQDRLRLREIAAEAKSRLRLAR